MQVLCTPNKTQEADKGKGRELVLMWCFTSISIGKGKNVKASKLGEKAQIYHFIKLRSTNPTQLGDRGKKGRWEVTAQSGKVADTFNHWH